MKGCVGSRCEDVGLSSGWATRQLRYFGLYLVGICAEGLVGCVHMRLGLDS